MKWLLCLLLTGCMMPKDGRQGINGVPGKDGVAGEDGHVVVTIDNETANDCIIMKQDDVEVYVIKCRASSVVVKEKEECKKEKKEKDHDSERRSN